MRTDSIKFDDVGLFLRLLTPGNALVMETCLQTGLRVSDVLSLRSDQLKQRMSVKQAKTGKTKRIYLSKKLLSRLQAGAGDVWVFPGCRDPEKHRTRQAVWADVKRASKALRIDYNAAPHSARKTYACDLYLRSGGGTKGLEAVRKSLQHEFSSVTIVYLADLLLKS